MTQVVSFSQLPPMARHAVWSHFSWLLFFAWPAGAPLFRPTGAGLSSPEPALEMLALPAVPPPPPRPAVLAMAEPPAPGAYGPAAAVLERGAKPAVCCSFLSSPSSRKPSIKPQLVIAQTAPRVSTKARSERRLLVMGRVQVVACVARQPAGQS